MYKPSKYNFIWPLDDGFLVYNSFTTAMANTDRSRVTMLETERIDPEEVNMEDRNTVLEFIKNGFLIDEAIDELKVLKYSSNSYKYKKDTLSLTIAPTLACNFNCAYCYQESGKTSTMSENVQDGIINYIEHSIKKLEKLYITWFGGEPLLAKQILLKLSDRIEKLAKENNCELSFFMITNGYLIDQQLITELKRLGLTGIQVTLDGPPRIHNQRRGLKKGGNSSFERILCNIQKLIDNDIKVYIRVNVDKTNVDSVEEFLDILKSKGIMDAYIYPAQVVAYTKACKSASGSCLSTVEYSDIDYKVHKMLIEKGFHKDFSPMLPKRKTNYCCADQVNSLLIDPQGSLYKCWNHIGTEETVGNIVNQKSTKVQKMRQVNWIDYNPFDHKECTECKYLPLCMGGCPYLGMVTNDGKPECMKTKHNLSKIIMSQYECRKENEISNCLKENKTK